MVARWRMALCLWHGYMRGTRRVADETRRHASSFGPPVRPIRANQGRRREATGSLESPWPGHLLTRRMLRQFIQPRRVTTLTA
eukprot:scaffold9087_cov119-Isochrysis_galbana.AAC.4